ncbi:hypothetical protein Btru_058930 [Bulinus truncatus]|nr:hypothetical protein Btru_058930 [Bulinus truncatus]
MTTNIVLCRLGKPKRCAQESDQPGCIVKVEEYEYPFESLIFGGGGIMGLSYVGTLQCLEMVGIMPQVKRLAGSSAGALAAAAVALGYNSQELEQIMSDDWDAILNDHSCGYCSLLPNLLIQHGWNPGEKFHEWLGEKIKIKSAKGNPDMTFYDIYKEKNIELCVVVTNLNQLTAEYCHIKTTPHMSVRDALRMSMSIPGFFSPVEHNNHGKIDEYVDGGIVTNYPIHSFDGWYLSLSPENSFLQKMTPLSDLPNILLKRFDEVNDKTLGFLLYNDTDMNIVHNIFGKRVNSSDPQMPAAKTQLYKEKQQKKKLAVQAGKEHRNVVKAVEIFLNALKKYNLADQEFIDKNELYSVLQDKQLFPEECSKLLFGPDISLDKAFCILDKDGHGKIAFLDLVQFIEAHGVRMQARFQDFRRRSIDNLGDFIFAVKDTLLATQEVLFLKGNDQDRTVGINCGYIESLDFQLEKADREFIIKRGFNATRAYLKYFISQHPYTKKRHNK